MQMNKRASWWLRHATLDDVTVTGCDCATVEAMNRGNTVLDVLMRSGVLRPHGWLLMNSVTASGIHEQNVKTTFAWHLINISISVDRGWLDGWPLACQLNYVAGKFVTTTNEWAIRFPYISLTQLPFHLLSFQSPLDHILLNFSIHLLDQSECSLNRFSLFLSFAI